MHSEPNPSAMEHKKPTFESMHVLVPNRRLMDKRFISQVVGEPVNEFSISQGAKHGDNMMGKLLALDIKTESKEIHNLVIKSVLPMSGVIDRKTLTSSRFIAWLDKFPREILYYSKVRPVFHEFTQNRDNGNISSDLFSSPKYYSSFSDASGLNDYLALEDLRPLGYKMANKFKGLRYEEVVAVLKQIALLHATSYCLLNQKPKEFSEVEEEVKASFNIHIWGKLRIIEKENRSFLNVVVSKMIDILQEKGEHEICSRMERYAQEGDKIVIGLWKKTGENGGRYFRVMIHGDLWINNILFRYAHDKKTVEDVKLVDFQDTRIGNIYEELHYFLFTSTTAEFRKNHLKSCLQIYYQEFADILQRLECPVPTGFSEEELIKTWLENLDYGFCYNVVALPFQLGLMPPPPSPMTPIELGHGKVSDNKFFPVVTPQNHSTSHSDNANIKAGAEGNVEPEPDFQNTMIGLTEDLKIGMRNSPVAQQRLKEMIDEMIEHGVL